MREQISYAAQADVLQLKELWRLCFGDEQSYIDFYYQTGFSPQNTLVLRVGQTVAAMLTLMPCQIKLPSQTLYLQYVYAVATHPNWQGRGFSTKLLQHARQEATKAGVDYLCLTPASESLFGYYAKRGYQPFFARREGKLQAQQVNAAPSVTVQPLPAAELFAVRSHFLQNTGLYVDWLEQGTQYRGQELLQTGAQILTFLDSSLQGMCACYNKEETAYIKELLCAPGFEDACTKATLAHLGCQQAVICTHTASQWRPTGFASKPYAMLCPAARQHLPKESVYINLCLD